MNRPLLLTAGVLCFSSLINVAYSFSLFSPENRHATTGKPTLNIKSSKNFAQKTAEMNKCYLKSQTNCNGQDMSDHYWSSNPDEYWSSINESFNNNSTWSAPERQISAPLPSNTPLTTQQQPQQQQTYAYHSDTLLPGQGNASNTQSNSSTSNDSSGGSFIIS